MTAAPELSVEERATVARFEAAVEPEEIRALREASPEKQGLPEWWIDADWTYYS